VIWRGHRVSIDEPQNIYDDPRFFEGYRELRRENRGFNALEQRAVRARLPELAGLTVLDLGCGFGTFAVWAAEEGAASVVGVDVSAKMLATAHQVPGVSYWRAAIEEVSFPPGSFDLVVSSLALHYVADFGAVVERVASWLRPNGRFVFSVEHPITTAHMDMPDWVGDEEGTRLNCPVDDYGDEGPRTQEWFVPGVRKYHRRLSTYVNTLIDAGLIIDGVDEPVPTPETIADHPVLADELRQPAFLVVACRKPEKGG